MTDTYQSSTGPKLIATMNPHNLAAAHAKLVREGRTDRQDEIDALAARMAEIEAEAPPAIGHNMPPEPMPETAGLRQKAAAEVSGADTFEAIRVHIEDLDTEARNWADGVAIENEAQAAEVDRLIDDFKAAIKVAEGVQAAMLAPLAEQEKEIRARFYPLIGKTSKITGTAIRDRDALLAVKTKWGNVLEARRRAEADALRAEAFAKAAEARAALVQAPDNIEATESAEDLIKAAQGLLKGAKQAETATVRGMRDNYVPHLTDGFRALGHYWRENRPALEAFALQLAQADVRAGKRSIPGFDIVNERRAA